MEEPATSSGRKFHLKQIIGEGAFGEVYLAEQDSGAGFRRKVAIKLLNRNVSKSREAGRRMRDEARILGLLSHRNIVTVLDLVRLGERWAVIMDFVPGADLEQVLDALAASERPFPVAAALEAGAAVCAALDAAHNAVDTDGSALRVVHRDIKPSNVRLTLDGEVKVLDFGVARVQLEARESSTRGSAWLGTERYMAPERILCESDDAPGDVYANAASIVELLIGRPLGRTPVLEERHAPFVEEALVLASNRVGNGELGEELCASLRRALAAEPDQRPTAAAFGDELRSLARRASGQTLVEFCRDFVGEVPAVLGHQPRPASGVLSEVLTNADSGTYPVMAPVMSSAVRASASNSAATLMPDDPVLTEASSGISRASKGLGILAIVAIVLGAGGVALLGIGAIVFAGFIPNGRTPEPVVVPQPMPDPEPVVEPEPVAEPGPLTEPNPDAVETEPDAAEPDPDAVETEPDAVEPEPEPAPQPVVKPDPRPVRPAPEPEPEPEPEVDPNAPRVSGALVALPDAAGLQVTCGDVSASGTASARLRNFPAGTCSVEATYLGKAYTTTVRIEGRREVRCSVDAGALTCR